MINYLELLLLKASSVCHNIDLTWLFVTTVGIERAESYNYSSIFRTEIVRTSILSSQENGSEANSQMNVDEVMEVVSIQWCH